MNISRSIASAALLAVAAMAAVGRTVDTQSNPIARLFQAAYDQDPSYWNGLPYTTMTRPEPIFKAPAADGSRVVLVRALIDLYMNQVRLETAALSELAQFVAELPVGHVPIQELTPSQADGFNVIEMIGAILQPKPPEPHIESTLVVAKIILDLFGPMLRDALFSDDRLDAQRVTSFVDQYVQHMGMPPMTALAMLARDLVLAGPAAAPTAAQVERAGRRLGRYVVLIDGRPELSHAADLMTGIGHGDFQFAAGGGTPPLVVLNLLVDGLGRDHVALREFCIERAGKIAAFDGGRMATLVRQMAFLMAITRTTELVELLYPLSADEMAVLAQLALGLDQHRAVIARIVAGIVAGQYATTSKESVQHAIRETIDHLTNMLVPCMEEEDWSWLPALTLLDCIKDALPSGIPWPSSFL